MIIDKKRIAAALLALVLACLAFVSCSNDGNALDGLEKMSDRYSSDSTGKDSDKSEINYLGVILPDDCSSALSMAARMLASALEERLDVNCVVAYDTEAVIQRDDYAEISLGRTNRDIARIVTDGFRDKDYACVSLDGHTVIGGVSDEATLTAIEYFGEQLLSYAEAELLVSEKRAIEYRGEYDIDQMLLCGYDISEYVLLCVSDEAEEFAVFLRDAISEKYGTKLDIVKAQTRTDGRKEISLGVDPRSSGAYLLRQGEDILAMADSTYGLSYLTEEFYEMLFDGADDGSVSCDMTEMLFDACDGKSIGVTTMLTSIKIDSSDDMDEAVKLINFINACDSDVLAIGNMSWETWNIIRYEINTDKYAVLALAEDSKNVFPILYRNDTLKLSGGGLEYAEELGLQKLTFEHKSSGDKYVINVLAADNAADYGSDIIKTLSQNDTATVTVLTSYATKMSVKGENVSVVLNANVNLYDSQLYHGIFYRSDRTITKNAFMNTLDAYTCYISFDVEVRYCDDYLKLLSDG